MAGYFLYITFTLIVTLIIFLTNWITNKLRKEKKTFLNKLGEPLIDEIQLEDENLTRTVLDQMYINVITINEIIDSNELYTYLNQFSIDVIDEQYQLMRLKYRRLKNKIENKIFELDGQFQSYQYSIGQPGVVFNNRRIARGLQKELSINSKFNQQIKSLSNAQDYFGPKSGKLINMGSNANSNLKNFSLENPPNSDHPHHLLCRSQFKYTDYYMFKYPQPNNLDLAVKKYNKVSFDRR